MVNRDHLAGDPSTKPRPEGRGDEAARKGLKPKLFLQRSHGPKAVETNEDL